MKFTRERPDGMYTIHACSPAGVRINSPSASDPRDADGRLWLDKSFILTPRWLHQPWRPASLDDLGPEDLALLSRDEVEVILLGTGQRQRLPAARQLATLVGWGVGYEIMDTAAACRTYNILAGEGRRVAVLIFAG